MKYALQPILLVGVFWGVGMLASRAETEHELASVGEAGSAQLEADPLPLVGDPVSDEIWLPHRVIPTAEIVPEGIYRLTDIGRNGAGELCLADTGNGVVLVVDRDLRHLRTLGRPGAGPGEFGDWQLRCTLADDGTAFVYDLSQRRLSRFDPSGQFEGSDPASVPARARLLADGTFVYNDGASVVRHDPTTNEELYRLEFEGACQLRDPEMWELNAWTALAPDASWGVLVSFPSCVGGESYQALLVDFDEQVVTPLELPLIRQVTDSTIATAGVTVTRDRAIVFHGSATTHADVSVVRADVIERTGVVGSTWVPRISAFVSAFVDNGILVVSDRGDDRLVLFDLANAPLRPEGR